MTENESPKPLFPTDDIPMHNEPREKLRELIIEYGRSLCDDPRRCEALLKDYCGQYKREIFALVIAQKNRVAEDLLKASSGMPQSVIVARLIKRLEDELGLAEKVAHWAVESWVLALDVIQQPLPAIKPTPAPLIPPTAIQSPPLRKGGEGGLLAAPPALKPLSTFRDRLRDGSAGPAMIMIPAGEFWMGSPESEMGRKNERERCHQVTIDFCGRCNWRPRPIFPASAISCRCANRAIKASWI